MKMRKLKPWVLTAIEWATVIMMVAFLVQFVKMGTLDGLTLLLAVIITYNIIVLNRHGRLFY